MRIDLLTLTTLIAVAPLAAAEEPQALGLSFDAADRSGRPGLSVDYVTLGSIAERTGIRRGDRLLSIGGAATTAKLIDEQVRGCEGLVEMVVERNGRQLTLVADWTAPVQREGGARPPEHTGRVAGPPPGQGSERATRESGQPRPDGEPKMARPYFERRARDVRGRDWRERRETQPESGPRFLNEVHPHLYRLAIPPGWTYRRFPGRDGPRLLLERDDPRMSIGLIIMEGGLFPRVDEALLVLLEESFGASFDAVRHVSREIAWHEGKPAGWFEFEGDVGAATVRVRQLAVRHSGRLYVMTVTADPGDWQRALREWDAVLENVELVDAPPLRVDASGTLGFRIFAHDVWREGDVEKASPGYQGTFLVRRDQKIAFRVIVKDMGLTAMDFTPEHLENVAEALSRAVNDLTVHHAGRGRLAGMPAGVLEWSGELKDSLGAVWRKRQYLLVYNERVLSVVAEARTEDWDAALPEIDLLLEHLELTDAQPAPAFSG